MLPYYLRHYSKFCSKITVYDQHSTDNTFKILTNFSHPECQLDIVEWGDGLGFNDWANRDVKTLAYKQDRNVADWSIVSDCDEFLWHPNLIEKLRGYIQSGINLPNVHGYNMMPNCDDIDPNVDLAATYNHGEPFSMYDKPMIFDPSLELKFHPGCHWLDNKPDNLKISQKDDFLFLLHYRKLNLKYWIERSQELGKRLSDDNKRANMGLHNLRSAEELEKDYYASLNKAVEVYHL